jgi:hypothetical protein
MTDRAKTEFHKLAKQKGWLLGEIAKRWGVGERQMSRLANKPKQKDLDAVSGLPEKIKARDMINKNIKLVTAALEHSEVVILNGGVASGKSTVISELVPKQFIIDKKLSALHGENIEVLASDLEITSSSEYPIIAIDEAQLFSADQLLTLVSSAVASKTKVIVGVQKIRETYLAKLEASLGDSVNIEIVEVSSFDKEVDGDYYISTSAKSGAGLSIPSEKIRPAPEDDDIDAEFDAAMDDPKA